MFPFFDSASRFSSGNSDEKGSDGFTTDSRLDDVNV